MMINCLTSSNKLKGCDCMYELYILRELLPYIACVPIITLIIVALLRLRIALR